MDGDGGTSDVDTAGSDRITNPNPRKKIIVPISKESVPRGRGFWEQTMQKI